MKIFLKDLVFNILVSAIITCLSVGALILCISFIEFSFSWLFYIASWGFFRAYILAIFIAGLIITIKERLRKD